MDDGRIDVSTNHSEGYACEDRESAVALTMFIVMLFITSTHRTSLMFLD